MGRFLKLNQDIEELAFKMLQDEDLRKLIYYSDTDPYAKPNVSWDKILDKNLLIFKPKIININETGTYIVIRAGRIKSSRGRMYIVSNLYFDIICHQDSRKTVYGDRIFLIMDKIEEIMKNLKFSIGDIGDRFEGANEINVKDNIWGGYSMSYGDVDWREVKVDE